MNLISNLKKTVEKVQTKEEAKDTIMKAGVLLKDEQLDLVAGGAECGICKSYGMMKLGTITYIGRRKIRKLSRK